MKSGPGEGKRNRKWNGSGRVERDVRAGGNSRRRNNNVEYTRRGEVE